MNNYLNRVENSSKKIKFHGKHLQESLKKSAKAINRTCKILEITCKNLQKTCKIIFKNRSTPCFGKDSHYSREVWNGCCQPIYHKRFFHNSMLQIQRYMCMWIIECPVHELFKLIGNIVPRTPSLLIIYHTQSVDLQCFC